MRRRGGTERGGELLGDMHIRTYICLHEVASRHLHNNRPNVEWMTGEHRKIPSTDGDGILNRGTSEGVLSRPLQCT